MKDHRLFKALLITASLALLMCLSVVAILNISKISELEVLQCEKLEALATQEGNYNEHNLVLYNTTREEAELLKEKLGATMRITGDGSFAILALPEGMTITDVYTDDSNREYLPRMDADFYVALDEVSVTDGEIDNEPNYTQQKKYLDYIGLGDVHGTTKGEGVTVAVIDSGIDVDHPDFEGDFSEYSYNASFDTVVRDNTLEDGSYDWSVIDDVRGHGTYVAGVISAKHNGIGGGGIAPDAELMVIKVTTNEKGLMSNADLTMGIHYAADRGVDVINMSWGSASASNYHAAAIAKATEKGSVCVASAGNDTSINPHSPSLDPNVISATALANNSWEIASYSNYGMNGDMSAPGTVYTTKIGGNYSSASGTSFASPITAAAVALYLSQHEDATIAEVREALYASCKDLGYRGNDYVYSFGALSVEDFVLGEQGQVTFDLCDGSANETSIFIRGKVLQDMPVPRSSSATFVGWYYDKEYTRPYNWYTDVFTSDLTLYAKWDSTNTATPFITVPLDDGTLEIRAYTGVGAKVTVPDRINGIKVTRIGDEAFLDRSDLTEIILPDTVTDIGFDAFEGCDNLKYSTYGNGMYIGDGDTEYAYLVMPTDRYVTSLNVHDDAKVICRSVAAHCESLQSIKLSFIGLSKATKSGEFFAEIFGAIKPSFSSSSLPENLKTVVIDGDTDIGAEAFRYCNIIETVIIGNKVRSLSNYAFQSVSKLKTVIIGNGITAIGNGAFKSCSSLTDLSMGINVRSIGSEAFRNCSKLKTVNYKATSAEWRSIAKGTNWNYSSGAYTVYCTDGTLSRSDVFTAYGSGAVTDDTAFKASTVYETYRDSLPVVRSDAIQINADQYDASLSASKVTSSAKIVHITDLDRDDYFGDFWNMGHGAFAYDKAVTTSPLDATDSADRAKTVYRFEVPDDGKYEFIFLGAAHVDSIDASNPLRERGFAYSVDGGNISQINCSGSKGVSAGDAPVYSYTSAELEAESDRAISAFYQPTYYYNISAELEAGEHTLEFFHLFSTSDGSKCVGGSNGIDLMSLYVQEYLSPDELENYEYDSKLKFEYTDSQGLSFTSNKNGTCYLSGLGNCKDTRIVIPATSPSGDSVTAIGSNAFRNYSKIVEIVIPESVTEISSSSFYNLQDLTAVRFPDSLVSLSATFTGCPDLASLNIPKNVSSLNLQISSDCTAIRSLTVDKDNTKYHSSDNCIIETDAKTLLVGCNYSSIPADGSVTSIGRYAFNFCDRLSETAIPDTVTSIGNNAFYGCSGLKKIVIPSKVSSIGTNAFGSCYSVKSISVDKNNSYFSSEGNCLVEKSSGRLIKGCNSSVIPADGSVRAIDTYAFAYCDGMTEIVIPDSVTFIGTYAFYKCSSLADVTLSQNITAINGYTFHSCTSLTKINIPDKVVTIDTYAFYGCEKLQDITLSENLTTIKNYAFYSCKALTRLTFPDKVTSIGSYTFCMCDKLTSVTFPKNLTRISSRVFQYCKQLKDINIPSKVTSIDDSAFFGCSALESITVDKANTVYYSLGNCLIKTSSKELILGSNGSVLTSDADVTSIGANAFRSYRNLTSITIPDAVTTIGNYAFNGCTALKEIAIPAKVTSIGDQAFYDCQSVEKITVDERNTVYRSSGNCLIHTGYKSLIRGCNTSVIPSDGSVTDIDASAFAGCTGLTQINIPRSITSAGASSFFNCTNLAVVYISSPNVVSMLSSGSGAGWLINKAVSVLIEEDLENVPSYVTSNFGHREPLTSNGTNYVSYSKHDHSWGSRPTVTDDGHYYKCSVCGIYKDNSTHVYSNSCDATCNVCNYTRAASHSTNAEWSYSETAHWNVCTVCKSLVNHQNHIYDNACDSGCNTCGYTRVAPHSYSSSWSRSDTHHYHECTGCDAISDNEEHVYSDQCDTVCNTCSYARTAPHDYSEEWISSGTLHWHKCNLCDTIKDIESHSLQETVAPDHLISEATCTSPAIYHKSCTVCGANGDETFEYGAATQHQFTSESTEAKYLVSGATCTKKAVYSRSCSTCGLAGGERFEYGTVADHVYTKRDDSSAYLKSSANCTSATTYYFRCENCTSKGNDTYTVGAPLGHTGGSATCTKKAECTRCSQTYGSTLSHSYTQRKTTASYLCSGATCIAKAKYYFSCACGAKGPSTFDHGEIVSHRYEKTPLDACIKSKATCSAKAVYYESCYVCRTKSDQTFEYGDILEHSYSSSLSFDKDGHWYECTACHAKKDITAHVSGGPATETDDEVCTLCGAMIKEALRHIHRYKDEWAHDETSHWQICSCGHKGEAEAHVWDNGRITVEPTKEAEGKKTFTCSVCGETAVKEIPKLDDDSEIEETEKATEKATETDTDGKTVESDKTHGIPEPTTDGCASTLGGSAAVLGISCFSLLWFAFGKKKRDRD